MKLFILEFITGGGLLGQPLPSSLQREGQLMLDELLRLASLVEDVDCIITSDARLQHRPSQTKVVPVEKESQFWLTVEQIMEICDAVWIVAPETNCILEKLIRVCNQKKVDILNCSADAIHITGDKLKCAHRLKRCHIPTIPLLSETDFPYERVVVKPRYGVGCEGLRIFDADSYRSVAADYSDIDSWIVQPYINGSAASLTLFCWADCVRVLSYNEQILEYQVDRLHLKQCITNAEPGNADLQRLAENIMACIPGLQGCVGIDLIKNEDQYWVVEINPRLTTSAVGLYDATGVNFVALCLEALRTQQMPVWSATRDRPVIIDIGSPV